MARSDFLQYPEYHKPTPQLEEFSGGPWGLSPPGQIPDYAPVVEGYINVSKKVSNFILKSISILILEMNQMTKQYLR